MKYCQHLYLFLKKKSHNLVGISGNFNVSIFTSIFSNPILKRNSRSMTLPEVDAIWGIVQTFSRYVGEFVFWKNWVATRVGWLFACKMIPPSPSSRKCPKETAQVERLQHPEEGGHGIHEVRAGGAFVPRSARLRDLELRHQGRGGPRRRGRVGAKWRIVWS